MFDKEALDILVLGLFPSQQHVNDDQRPGIDEGVAGNTFMSLKVDDRVKGIAGGLSTDTFPHLVLEGFKCHR